jgi:hypothetical protein
VAALEGPRLFRRHYKPTPYDDLLTQLDDRDRAAAVGRAYRAAEPGFSPPAAANALRARIGHDALADAIRLDLSAGRIAIVQGWVLPESLVLLCGLAAG